MTTMMQEEAVDTGNIVLADGIRVGFRPILPTDQQALQRFHARLSDRSVYQRFFMPQPRLGDTQAHYFTHVDGVKRFALVALDPEEPGELIGVVRWDRDDDGESAEYAAVVADRWQGRGLGLALTQRLIETARQRGLRSLYAMVLPGNAQMLGLLRDLGLPEQIRHLYGADRVEVEIGDHDQALSHDCNTAPHDVGGREMGNR